MRCRHKAVYTEDSYVITEESHDLAAIVDPGGDGTYGARDIDGGEGIRGVLGRDKGTEQDT